MELKRNTEYGQNGWNICRFDEQIVNNLLAINSLFFGIGSIFVNFKTENEEKKRLILYFSLKIKNVHTKHTFESPKWECTPHTAIGFNLIEHSIQSHHKVSFRSFAKMETDMSRVFLVFIFNYLTMPLEILSK